MGAAVAGEAVVPRDDVRLHRADGWVYVSASDGPPLRWRPDGDGGSGGVAGRVAGRVAGGGSDGVAGAGSDGVAGGGSGAGSDAAADVAELAPSDLPASAVAALRRRGLLVPAAQTVRRHPSYADEPPPGATVRVFGTDPLSARVAERVAAAGVATSTEPPATAAEPSAAATAAESSAAATAAEPSGVGPRSTAAGVGHDVLVVGLAAPDPLLTEVSALAVRLGAPVVIHAAAGARLYWAVLRPPVTACPLCVAVRIRAGRADRTGRLGLRSALGTTGPDRATSLHWPTDEASAALVAHQAVRALTGAGPNPTGSVDADRDPATQTAQGLRESAPVCVAGPEGTAGPDPGLAPDRLAPDSPAPDSPDLAELVEVDLDEGGAVRHPLLPTPGCPACADAVPPAPERPGRSTEECWRQMQRAVDPLTGIVSGLAVLPPEDGQRDCTVVWAQGGTDTTWFSSVRASTVGGATKADPLAARVCAVGETLERYAAGIHRPGMFVRATLTELGADAVDPRELPLGSPGEYRDVPELAPYHPDLPIDWVCGRSLVTGRARYLPAAAVYVPYRAPRREERLLHPNSTGLAAGSDTAHATLGGLLEVIERDSAAVVWYNRLVTPTLDWTTAPPEVAGVLRRVAERGVQLLAKDITTDLGVPAVLLLGRFTAPDGAPVALCGFRADPTRAGCLLGAAQELEHLLAMYRRSVEQGRPPVPDPAAEPRDIWDFATYYCHGSRIGALEFLADGPLIPVSDGDDGSPTDSARVAWLVERLHARGHEPVAVDITPVDVAACGVRVVRTVVPGLQPVSFHRRFRHLGGRRVFESPVRMGLRAGELTEAELNPDPIPLG